MPACQGWTVPTLNPLYSPTAAATLIAAIGSSNMLFLYDGLNGITGAGNVFTWTSQIAGAPVLSNYAAAPPTYNGATGAVTFNGTTQALWSAASSVFALNQAYSMALVVSGQGSGNDLGGWGNIADSGSFNRTLGLGPNFSGTANTVFAAYSGTGAGNEVNSALAFNSANIYLLIVSQDGSLLYLNPVPLTALTVANGGLQASGSNVLTLGNSYRNTAGDYLAGSIYGIAGLPAVVSSTQIGYLQTWASNYSYTLA
jgi:hypothetical protein